MPGKLHYSLKANSNGDLRLKLAEHPIRRVHILGAGFTHTIGLPLCFDLLTEMDRFMLKDYRNACKAVHGPDKAGTARAMAELFTDWWDELRYDLSHNHAAIVNANDEGYVHGNIEAVLKAVEHLI